jgi:hypothetical protein
VIRDLISSPLARVRTADCPDRVFCIDRCRGRIGTAAANAVITLSVYMNRIGFSFGIMFYRKASARIFSNRLLPVAPLIRSDGVSSVASGS